MGWLRLVGSLKLLVSLENIVSFIRLFCKRDLYFKEPTCHPICKMCVCLVGVAVYIDVCSELQCVAVCCSVLQCVAVYIDVCSELQCVAVCCSVLQCIAVCCGIYRRLQ